MHFKRQVKDEDTINLTPLIDVVFLLLIFFMVSTTFTKETHLKLALPEAEGAPQPDVPEMLEVIINAEGGIAVNGDALVDGNIKTLMRAIEEKGHGNTKLPFVITADSKVPYETVVMAMDAAGRLGYVNISMTTKKPEGGGE